MQKILSRLVLLFLVTPLIFSSINPFSLNTPKAQQSSGTSNFIIYVNSTIISSINSEIVQYKADVEAEGYTVKVYNWMDPNPDPFQRASSLKFNITQEYTTNGLNGTVFVGDMPFALYEQSPGFDYICDLYFMDMNGLWTNPDGDFDLDSHSNGTGDMYPEIFVGRINPRPVNNTHEVTLLQKYFQRNHDYHAGNSILYNNSLMYIDDDWESWSHEWKGDLLYLYNNITLINNTIETTNSTNYLKEIIKPYDWGHMFIHSDSVQHYFKNGSLWGVDGNIHSLQLKAVNLSLKFYMLYCCYAARFDASDNIATQYLFSPTTNSSLAVFGSSTSGGFLMNQYLYEPLSQGWTLGEAFKHWWFNDILDPVVKTHGPTDPTVRGNILLGDPSMTIREISSPEEPPHQLTPLQLTLIIVGPILAIGLTSLIIVAGKNRKAKKE